MSIVSNFIASVIPSKYVIKWDDYNMDGNTDLLIVYNKTYNSQFKFDLKIYDGNNCPNETCTFTESAHGIFT